MKTILTATVILGVLALFALGGYKGCDVSCTNHDATVETLQKSGYKDIVPGDYAWFECGEDDSFHTSFTATNPAGDTVEGTVCCGWFAKGCTIRY